MEAMYWLPSYVIGRIGMVGKEVDPFKTYYTYASKVLEFCERQRN